MNINGLEVRLCNPVDTILLKAIPQREAGEDKHDLEDIGDLIKKVRIDKTYLKKRLELLFVYYVFSKRFEIISPR